MSLSFIHLETHSYDTLLGSTLSVADLVIHALAEGMTRLALTGIKPLVVLLPREWHPSPRQRERRSVEGIVAQITDPRQKEIVH